jgi:alpha-1,3-rhamnosyltransferase
MMTEGSETRPLVTVIVPVYNGEAFLEETLHSVWQQTYPQVTLLAVDDGSTDGSLPLLRRYAAEGRLVLVEHGHNQGLNQAIATGVEAASGDYVAILGQDDLLVPTKIAHQVAFMQQHAVDAVYAGGYTYSQHLETGAWEAQAMDLSSFAKLAAQSPQAVLHGSVYPANPRFSAPMSQSALFCRQTLLKYNPLRRQIRLDDWPVLLKLYENDRVGFINEPMFYWRLHANNSHKRMWWNYAISVEAVGQVVPPVFQPHVMANVYWVMANHFYEQRQFSLAFRFTLSSLAMRFQPDVFWTSVRYGRKCLSAALRQGWCVRHAVATGR